MLEEVPHTHEAPDPHASLPDQDDTITHHKMLEIALRELLVAKGILTAEDVRIAIERMDLRGPHLGAQAVAHAWVDDSYRQRLVADGTAACKEIGILMDTATRLIVVENTPQVHNLVVCTLCSCYPRQVLGLPPDWYKSREYRSRAVREPRTVLSELGTELPANVTVRVHDSTADMRYLVLPMRPAGTDGWSEEQLAGIVTRDTMIGVTVPKVAR